MPFFIMKPEKEPWVGTVKKNNFHRPHIDSMNFKSTPWSRCGHLCHSDEETETQRVKLLDQVPGLLGWALHPGHVSAKLILITRTTHCPFGLFFVPGCEKHNFSHNRSHLLLSSTCPKSPAPYRFSKNHISPLLMHPSKTRWALMASKAVAPQGAMWDWQRKPGTCQLHAAPAGTAHVSNPRTQY